jgi:signal transduction histidine kinase
MIEKRIEDFFLRTILSITFISVLFIVVMDWLFMDEKNFFGLGGMADVSVLIAITVALVLHKFNYYLPAVLLPICVATFVLLGISILNNNSASTAMFAMVAVGFSVSILLKNKIKIVIHTLIFMGIVLVFFIHLNNYLFYLYSTRGQVVIVFSTYGSMYLIITYSASILKETYDRVNLELKEKNIKLLEQTVLMAHQKNEVIESRNELNKMNQNLETIIMERTNNVKQKNEYLIKYSFANAHYVRGPLARILGLLQLAKLEETVDYPFLFLKIDEQAKEIDIVLKKINKELEEGQDIFYLS